MKITLERWNDFWDRPRARRAAWVFLAGELFFYSPDGMQKIGDLPAYAVDMAIDGDGRLWLARLMTTDPQLWWYDSPVEENSP